MTTARTSPTSKELLQLTFGAPDNLIASITNDEAAAVHADLTAAQAQGREVDAAATISVLMAARDAMQGEVIYAAR